MNIGQALLNDAVTITYNKLISVANVRTLCSQIYAFLES